MGYRSGPYPVKGGSGGQLHAWQTRSDERQAAPVAEVNAVGDRALTVLVGAESVVLFRVDLTALRGGQEATKVSCRLS